MQTDAQGYTEREWEKLFGDRNRDDGAQTAHSAAFDDESYCDECGSEVDYSDGSKHGRCNCEEGS